MNARLQQFLNAENLTQSQFADKIGVARASISHIMAGRNKPGFDFILGMARSFPALNLDWLITGKGKMYKQAEASLKVTTNEPTLNLVLDDEKDEESAEVPAIKTPTPAPPPQMQENRRIVHTDRSPQAPLQRSISRIIVFYDDNTFQELH